MKTENLLLIGALGVAAYFLFAKKTSAAATSSEIATPTSGLEQAKTDFLNKEITVPVQLTPTIIVQVPTTSAIPTYYATPTTTTSKSNIIFKSASEVIAASPTPTITAQTIKNLESYAVSPYSTYRKNI